MVAPGNDQLQLLGELRLKSVKFTQLPAQILVEEAENRATGAEPAAVTFI